MLPSDDTAEGMKLLPFLVADELMTTRSTFCSWLVRKDSSVAPSGDDFICTFHHRPLSATETTWQCVRVNGSFTVTIQYTTCIRSVKNTAQGLGKVTPP